MQTNIERGKKQNKKKQPKPSDNFIIYFYDEAQLLHLHIYC